MHRADYHGTGVLKMWNLTAHCRSFQYSEILRSQKAKQTQISKTGEHCAPQPCLATLERLQPAATVLTPRPARPRRARHKKLQQETII
eukprot:4241959-Amphidinium_carterae.1